MRTTIAKMLIAQASIKPPNVRSASAEFPLDSRKSRISEAGNVWAPSEDATDDSAIPLAGSVAGVLIAGVSAVVSGFLIRISAKGTVTFLRLKAQYE